MSQIKQSGWLLLMGVLLGYGFSSLLLAQVNSSRVEGISAE